MMTAIAALHTPVLRMSHRHRPPLWLAHRGRDVLFAVFDAADAFLGLVGWRDVARHPRRIFADQVPKVAPDPVAPSASLAECLASMQRQRTTALPVVDDGAFKGAVTSASVLRRAAHGETSPGAFPFEHLYDELQRLEAINLELAGQLHDIRNELQIATSALVLSSGADAEDTDVGMALARAVALCRSAPADGPTVRRRPSRFGLGVVLEALLPTFRAALGPDGNIGIQGSPELRVLADRLDLERALINLVKNAAEAAVDGVRVSITVSDAGRPERLPNETWLAAGEHVRITITDNGPGMGSQTLRRVTSGDAIGDGHGLGLVTARRLVRRNGGTLWCHSRPGAGTTIELLLPSGQ